jgi:hypothetical protein
MKWFKHDTTASDDIKIKRLEEEYGNDGYATYFKTLEILGLEGIKGRLSLEKYPKKWISSRCHLSEEKLSEIFDFMGKISLCCPNSLKKNELYIPQFKERADDYTKRLRRKSEQTSDNVQNGPNNISYNRLAIYKQEFLKQYLTVTGVPYVFTYGKDNLLLKELLIFKDEDALALINEFFDSAKDSSVWWADKLSIGVFKTVIPQLIGRLRKNETIKKT